MSSHALSLGWLSMHFCPLEGSADLAHLDRINAPNLMLEDNAVCCEWLCFKILMFEEHSIWWTALLLAFWALITLAIALFVICAINLSIPNIYSHFSFSKFFHSNRLSKKVSDENWEPRHKHGALSFTSRSHCSAFRNLHMYYSAIWPFQWIVHRWIKCD